MRTASWILTPALVFGLAACPAEGGETDTDTSTTTTTTTMGTTTTTMGTTTTTTSTTDMTTDDPTTTTTTTTTSTTDVTSTTTGTTDMMTGTTGDAPACDAYCALYMMACMDFAEYDNLEACLAQCEQWPDGQPGATDGDSLACRTYHVTVANAQDPDMHCPHASPNGAGVCVDPAAPKCEDYCAAYLANCDGNNNAYKDEADCLDQCSHWWPGVKDAVDGDSVGCREYHAGNPALSDPDTHCPHAGPGGGGVCVAQ